MRNELAQGKAGTRLMGNQEEELPGSYTKSNVTGTLWLVIRKSDKINKNRLSRDAPSA